jgi:hypothetical protein
MANMSRSACPQDIAGPEMPCANSLTGSAASKLGRLEHNRMRRANKWRQLALGLAELLERTMRHRPTIPEFEVLRGLAAPLLEEARFMRFRAARFQSAKKMHNADEGRYADK